MSKNKKRRKPDREAAPLREARVREGLKGATHEERVAERDSILKRRRRILIAVIAVILACVMAAVLFAAGIFEKRADTNTLTVKSDGTVVYEELMDSKKASATDVKKFVKSEITCYNRKAGVNSIRLERFASSGGTIYVRTVYQSPKIYQDYTGYQLGVNTVKKALAGDQPLEGTFIQVKDGKKAKAVETSSLAKHPAYHVLGVRQNTTVTVPGTIRFLTDESTKLISADTVNIAQRDGNADATTLVYIIYE